MTIWFARSARAALLLVATVGCIAPAVAADITGAGATFPAPLYAKWASAYKGATQNALNYQAIGSGAGIAQIKARTVDFGATDDPMAPADMAAAGLVQFPAVIGSEVLIVNLPGVANGALRLTPAIVAGIYMGKITKWNDPAIAAINKGLPLRPMPITPVYRSDSSGTTAIFTRYLTKAARNWTLGAGKTISWPTGSGGKGNDGVAGNVKNTVGSIGYVEFNYAFANKLPMTKLANAAGKFVDPTPATFNAAAGQVQWPLVQNGTADMLALPGANTWPIVSATYILVPAKPADAAKTSAALSFFEWSYKKGAAMATQLGYLPLPPAAVNLVHSEWKKVVGGKVAMVR